MFGMEMKNVQDVEIMSNEIYNNKLQRIESNKKKLELNEMVRDCQVGDILNEEVSEYNVDVHKHVNIGLYKAEDYIFKCIKRTKSGHVTFDVIRKSDGKFHTRVTFTRADLDWKIGQLKRHIDRLESEIDNSTCIELEG